VAPVVPIVFGAARGWTATIAAGPALVVVAARIATGAPVPVITATVAAGPALVIVALAIFTLAAVSPSVTVVSPVASVA
jgi:hypothetical protein